MLVIVIGLGMVYLNRTSLMIWAAGQGAMGYLATLAEPILPTQTVDWQKSVSAMNPDADRPPNIIVILADDLIKSQTPCLKQMIDIYNDKQTAVLALEKINKKDADKYGIVEFQSKEKNIYDIKSIIEKPSPKAAKSNLGVVGRYILPANIFDYISKLKPGTSNEIQLTDAISSLLNNHNIYGYEFDGTRFDCGSKIGYLKATVEYAIDHKEVSKDFKKYLKNIKI